MEFEWDDANDRTNLKKHGVTFEDAAQIWFDPGLVVFEDIYAEGEARHIAIGREGDRTLLQVVHAYRGKEQQVVRIISARKATNYEKTLYSAQGA